MGVGGGRGGAEGGGGRSALRPLRVLSISPAPGAVLALLNP